MSDSSVKYIVYAPSFTADSGGTIFLHELVHALNTLGEQAYLWPMKPIFRQRFHNRIFNRIFPPPFQCNPQLDTPVARRSDIDEKTIVVYPEIVPGNPLQARHVARWLLYKPGERHPYEFTEGELFFRAFEKADLPELTGGAPELFLWKINRIYRNENRPDRSGVCYLLRKGAYKERIPETEVPGAICIDDLGPAEINDIFNRCEVFYSYDEATMYSQYAAICGCLSIVVPGEHASREEWAAQHDLYRYGVAYGIEDAGHALATRDKVLGMLEEKEKAGLDTVRSFIALTKERFAR